MQPAKLKAGYGMTLSACLWLGLFPLRASPSPAQLLAFAPGKEQAAGVWET